MFIRFFIFFLEFVFVYFWIIFIVVVCIIVIGVGGLVIIVRKEKGRKRSYIICSGLDVNNIVEFYWMLSGLKKLSNWELRLNEWKLEYKIIMKKLFVFSKLWFILNFVVKLSKEE